MTKAPVVIKVPVLNEEAGRLIGEGIIEMVRHLEEAFRATGELVAACIAS
jgi:hypothetical protein